jgi:hypothetical protein
MGEAFDKRLCANYRQIARQPEEKMRASRVVLVGLALTASLSGCSVLGMRDPVTHTIAQGGPVSLMPKPFDSSLTGSEVIRRLQADGYKPDSLPVFSIKRQAIPKDGRHYSKSVSSFPCLVIYDVVVRVDSSDRLIDAYGATRAMACT